MDGGAWWATVHRVTQSRTRLSDFTFTFRKTHTDPKGQKAGWLRGWGTRPEEETGKITVRRHFWEVAATQPSDANGFRNIYVGILFTYIHVLKYMHGYIYIYPYIYIYIYIKAIPCWLRWPRIYLPMQKRQVQSLGREDSPGEGNGNPLQYSWASLVAQMVKNPPAMQETWVQSLGREDPLEEEITTHSSILA